MARKVPIAAVAPFVGLFGTTVGIIYAFHETRQQEISLLVMAGGIADALISTALCLLVAVPAVWMYNYFNKQD